VPALELGTDGRMTRGFLKGCTRSALNIDRCFHGRKEREKEKKKLMIMTIFHPPRYKF
jgi:hypothetical protein